MLLVAHSHIHNISDLLIDLQFKHKITSQSDGYKTSRYRVNHFYNCIFVIMYPLYNIFYIFGYLFNYTENIKKYSCTDSA